MELRGVGVGRGIAVGPILRMPEPLPQPADAKHAGDAAVNAELDQVFTAILAGDTQTAARILQRMQ